MSEEIAKRTKAERVKQNVVKVGSAKRKANAQPTQQISPPSRSRPKKKSHSHNTSGGSSSGRVRKEKLYCLCRTPYDETK